MTKSLLHFTSLLFLFGVLSSCGMLLGIKTLAPISQTEIQKNAQELNIPTGQLAVIQTTYFDTLLALLENEKPGLDDSAVTALKMQLKNDFQPVQYKIYSENNCIFQLVNCFVKGGTQWKETGAFESSTPTQNPHIDLNQFDDLSLLFAHLTDVRGNSFQLPKATNRLTVIFWNNWMEKSSEKLIESFQQFHEKHPETTVIYVNNQNAWAGYAEK